MHWYDTSLADLGKKAFRPHKMKKKYHALTEHYLVPAVLFLLNICLAHTIYAFAGDSLYSAAGKIALVAAVAFLGSSLLLKKETLLAGAILFYAVVALCI